MRTTNGTWESLGDVVYLHSPNATYAYFRGTSPVVSWEGFAFRDADGSLRYGLWDALGDPHRAQARGSFIIVHDSLWVIEGGERRSLELASGAWRDLPALSLPEYWSAGAASGGYVPVQSPEGAIITNEEGIVRTVPKGIYHAIADGWFVERADGGARTAFVDHEGGRRPGPELKQPYAVAADPNGDAYVLLDSTIYRISPQWPFILYDWFGALPLALLGFLVWLHRWRAQRAASAI